MFKQFFGGETIFLIPSKAMKLNLEGKNGKIIAKYDREISFILCMSFSNGFNKLNAMSENNSDDFSRISKPRLKDFSSHDREV